MEKLELLPLKDIRLDDPFWNKYTRLVTKEIIPYQWETLNDRVPDAEPSHCISNFQVAAGLKEGTFEGAVFQDTDVAKWLEAVAYSLSYEPAKPSSPTDISIPISPSLHRNTAGQTCGKDMSCIPPDTCWKRR